MIVEYQINIHLSIYLIFYVYLYFYFAIKLQEFYFAKSGYNSDTKK